VYGLNEKIPFSESDNVDHPISLYAATKKSNELMAHTYSYLYKLPSTGLRFSRIRSLGRPDMALFILQSHTGRKAYTGFNRRNMERDFTYVDDIVEGIFRILKGDPPEGNAPRNGMHPDLCPPAPYKFTISGTASR
jgi:UDP-glucuronate 4-epimerase